MTISNKPSKARQPSGSTASPQYVQAAQLNCFGFSEKTWQAAKDEACAILVAKARTRSFITYSDLAAQLTTIYFAYDDERFFALLGTLASDEEAAGRGLLSVLVIHKYGDMQPGKGFYRLAKYWGRNIPDPTTFWVEEFKSIWNYWQSH
jgi:hypothetical protein